jgi:glutathione S-transferase
MSSGGARSFSLGVGEYLARRYGHAPDGALAARARFLEVGRLFERQLTASQAAGHRYLLGPELTALDIYLATFLTPVAPSAEADCPGMRPEARNAFAYLREEIGAEVPPALLAHRAFMFQHHLRHPIPL